MNFDKLKAHSVDNLGSGTEESLILQLEKSWGLNLPKEFRMFLKEIGYAEIYGDEIYSIYEVPDELACNGLHWMNKDNEELKKGFIEFYSNDIDGSFYIHNETGKIYLNSTTNEFANSFVKFIDNLLDE